MHLTSSFVVVLSFVFFIKLKIKTKQYSHHNAILLVGREEPVHLREVELLVQLGVVQVGPDGALDLALGQLGPVEGLERVGGLGHALRGHRSDHDLIIFKFKTHL